MSMQACRTAKYLALNALLMVPLFAGAWQTAAVSQPASAPSSGMRAEFLADLQSQQERFVSLAQAIPAEKYTWRPSEGVRSVSEVLLHVAAANYNLPTLFGVAPPAGFKVQGFDKSTTDKTKVIQQMQDAFAHMRDAVLSIPDSDMDKQVKFRGGKKSTRAVLMFILEHNAEHLGQLIAYARVNGVVPPWTEEQQKKAAEKPKQQ